MRAVERQETISKIVSVCCRVQHKPFSGDLQEAPTEAVSVCMYMPCYSSSIDVCIYIYISIMSSIFIEL